MEDLKTEKLRKRILEHLSQTTLKENVKLEILTNLMEKAKDGHLSNKTIKKTIDSQTPNKNNGDDLGVKKTKGKKQKKKKKKKQALTLQKQKIIAKKKRESEKKENEKEDMVANYPHEGKHRPPAHIGGNKKTPSKKDIITLTKRKGYPSLYFSSNPKEVIALEKEATDKGLDTKLGTIHCFDTEIGADSGFLTQCIRIDGDHGHPIMYGDLTIKTSFYSYMQKAITSAEEKGDKERIKEIKSYLDGNDNLDEKHWKWNE